MSGWATGAGAPAGQSPGHVSITQTRDDGRAGAGEGGGDAGETGAMRQGHDSGTKVLQCCTNLVPASSAPWVAGPSTKTGVCGEVPEVPMEPERQQCPPGVWAAVAPTDWLLVMHPGGHPGRSLPAPSATFVWASAWSSILVWW